MTKKKKKSRAAEMETNETSPPFSERAKTVASKSIKIFADYFLVIGMVLVFILGVQLPRAGLALAKIPTEYICVVVIFFIGGLQLKMDELLAGIKSYKAIIWGLLGILLVTPLLGMQITKTIHFATLSDENMTTTRSVVHANVSAIGPTEFAIGLQVFFTAPATMAIGIVLAVLAGGNLALALLVTMVTNIAGIFTVRPILTWMAGTASDVDMESLSFLIAIFSLTVVVPVLMGRILRLSQTVEEITDRYHSVLRCIPQVLLILLTWPKVSEAKKHNAFGDVVAMNLLAIIGYTSILHIIFLLINFLAACVLRLDLASKKTVVLLCSHKSLAFALKIVTFLPESSGSQELMSISCIIAHLTMIMTDSVLVCLWAGYKEEEQAEEATCDGIPGKYDKLVQQHDD